MKTLHTSAAAVLLAGAAALLAAAYAHWPEPQAAVPGNTAPPAAAATANGLPGAAAAPSAVPEPVVPAAEEADKPAVSRGLIYLDPGHQLKGDPEHEPVSPDSNVTKPKVTGGTRGVSTGKPEYVLNLEIALLLKEALVKRGFEVLMTREEHDVNLSNIRRAEMANEANAQLVVRIHADGNNSPKAQGYSVLYPDAAVAATQSIQPDSKLAAESILEALKAGTGASSRGLQPRKDLTGFNWSRVPVVLVEAGFMTNPAEDESLSDPEYQRRLAESIAGGIDSFMKHKEEQRSSGTG